MSYGGSCPFCTSTDIGETTGGKAICLDCEKTWVIGGKKKR